MRKKFDDLLVVEDWRRKRISGVCWIGNIPNVEWETINGLRITSFGLLRIILLISKCHYAHIYYDAIIGCLILNHLYPNQMWLLIKRWQLFAYDWTMDTTQVSFTCRMLSNDRLFNHRMRWLNRVAHGGGCHLWLCIFCFHRNEFVCCGWSNPVSVLFFILLFFLLCIILLFQTNWWWMCKFVFSVIDLGTDADKFCF